MEQTVDVMTTGRTPQVVAQFDQMGMGQCVSASFTNQGPTQVHLTGTTHTVSGGAACSTLKGLWLC